MGEICRFTKRANSHGNLCSFPGSGRGSPGQEHTCSPRPHTRVSALWRVPAARGADGSILRPLSDGRGRPGATCCGPHVLLPRCTSLMSSAGLPRVGHLCSLPGSLAGLKRLSEAPSGADTKKSWLTAWALESDCLGQFPCPYSQDVWPQVQHIGFSACSNVGIPVAAPSRSCREPG